MIPSSLLSGKGLLSPIQKKFIRLFANLTDKDQFYLTGGTALSEYYLGHRLSFDLDFFTGAEGLVLPTSYKIENLGNTFSLDISTVRRFSAYVEFLVKDDQSGLKVDLALDSPFRFEPAITTVDNIQVNNFHDLCIDKLLAYYGRTEPRDAVDLYFILQKESLEPLLEQSARKDPGFDLYWFAIALNRCENFPDELGRWPVKMLIPFEPRTLKRDFKKIAVQLMENLSR
jgi:hypothetical protein